MNEAIRAWKDPEFRASLSPEHRAALAAHPAGATWNELERDEMLALVGGASDISPLTSVYTCTWCVPTFGGCPPPA